MSTAYLNIATACLLDNENRLLVVRKRGSRLFMLPGGKKDPGETPMATLLRELREELDLSLDSAHLAYLGYFQARAADEPGHEVRADVYVGRLLQKVAV